MLRWKGQPVPWVTRWTSEEISPSSMRITRTREGIAYADERPSDRMDEVLWLRENDSPGVGEPMFKDVHSHRQRRCIVEGLCQTCGQLLPSPATWILPPGHLTQRYRSSLITDATPVCDTCLPVAMSSCPHLLASAGTRVVSVAGYRPWGVFGDVFSSMGHRLGDAQFGSYLGHMVARQMIVELWDYRKQRL